MIGKGGAARLRECHRPLRMTDRVRRGLAAAMAEIHHDAQLVHALDGFDTGAS